MKEARTLPSTPVGGPLATIEDTVTMLWRDLIRTSRQPEMLVFAVVMGVFFLVLFNYVFGGAIGAGADVDYLQFLVPGVFVITALQGAQQTSMGFAADLSEGVTDRFRSLPMSQFAVIAGRTLADAAAQRARPDPRRRTRPRHGLPVRLAVGSHRRDRGHHRCRVRASPGSALPSRPRSVSPSTVGMLSMFWLFPLMLASTAFTPADTMPGWLRPFAANQPISVAADAVRGLCEGTADTADLVVTGAWTIGLLAVFVPLSTRLYTRDVS